MEKLESLKTVFALVLLSHLTRGAFSSPCFGASPSPSPEIGSRLGSPTAPARSSLIEMVKSSDPVESLLNPSSDRWQSVPASTLPLFRQNVVTPTGGGSIGSVNVRCMRLPAGVIFRLDWSDSTLDNDTVHQSRFRDAVAIEFPVGGAGDTVLAMGSPHGPVNIWHWKADWEPGAPVMNDSPYMKDLDSPTGTNRASYYRRLHVDSPQEANTAQGRSGPTSGLFNLFPQSSHKSPVEDIVAVGISSITTKPSRFQNLQGKGVWRDGRWQVVVYKPLDSKDPSCPQFKPGSRLNTAVAVWNGSQQDRNGMKSLSNWTELRIAK